MEENTHAISYLERRIEEMKKKIREENKEVAALSNKIADMTAEKWVVIRGGRSEREILGVSPVQASRWRIFRFRLIDGEVQLCNSCYDIDEEVRVQVPVGGSISLSLRPLDEDHGPVISFSIYAFDDYGIARSHL